MIARAAAGVAGVLVALAALVFAPLAYFVLPGAVSNQCILDGGASDCYSPGTRLLLIGWGLAALGALGSIAYAGGGMVWWALTRRRARGVWVVAYAGMILAMVAAVPFLVMIS